MATGIKPWPTLDTDPRWLCVRVFICLHLYHLTLVATCLRLGVKPLNMPVDKVSAPTWIVTKVSKQINQNEAEEELFVKSVNKKSCYYSATHFNLEVKCAAKLHGRTHL